MAAQYSNVAKIENLTLLQNTSVTGINRHVLRIKYPCCNQGINAMLMPGFMTWFMFVTRHNAKHVFYYDLSVAVQPGL